jgi:hypothetical protein
MSIFEIVMLLCFGAAWPFSIYRTYRAKSNSGKSAAFLCIVLIGYAAGILHKILNNYDMVVWFYALNMMMVAVDLSLFIRNRLKYGKDS